MRPLETGRKRGPDLPQQLLVSVGSPWDERVKTSQREWLKVRNDDVSTSAPGKEMVEALKASLKARLASLNQAVSTHNGLRFLSIDRVALHKLDRTDIPPDSSHAKQRYVRQSRSPVYLLVMCLAPKPSMPVWTRSSPCPGNRQAVPAKKPAASLVSTSLPRNC